MLDSEDPHRGQPRRRVHLSHEAILAQHEPKQGGPAELGRHGLERGGRQKEEGVSERSGCSPSRYAAS